MKTIDGINVDEIKSFAIDNFIFNRIECSLSIQFTCQLVPDKWIVLELSHEDRDGDINKSFYFHCTKPYYGYMLEEKLTVNTHGDEGDDIKESLREDLNRFIKNNILLFEKVLNFYNELHYILKRDQHEIKG